MAWRTVVVTNPARLRVENSQLVIAQDQEIPVPLEDIGVLMLESQQVTLSSALLARIAESGTLLLVCDAKHSPVLAGLPYAGHSRLSGMHRMQLSTTLPFRKKCWQSIIKRKILNQAECLRISGCAGADSVAAFADMVGSGDPSNIESVAAREHFSRLFGKVFHRGENDRTNAALNYGYAVLRATVVRALAAHGFILSQGIHHCSELNPFNLADDFIEPLRPLVDLRVSSMPSNAEELSKEDRAALVSLLGVDMLIRGLRQSAMRSAEIMAASFVSACREKNSRLLELPTLLPLNVHRYE